jgi:hypothetical protein
VLRVVEVLAREEQDEVLQPGDAERGDVLVGELLRAVDAAHVGTDRRRERPQVEGDRRRGNGSDGHGSQPRNPAEVPVAAYQGRAPSGYDTLRMPTECVAPPSTDVQSVALPARVGTRRSAVLASPSWPLELRPQQ